MKLVPIASISHDCYYHSVTGALLQNRFVPCRLDIIPVKIISSRAQDGVKRAEKSTCSQNM